MSYPPTEADVISNDSLFSDSVEFDAAEKPIAPEDTPGHVDYSANQPSNDRGLPENEADDLSPIPQHIELEEEAAPPPPVMNAFMKPRRTATKPPQEWVPVALQVPADDPEDEFDISTAQKPIYADKGATNSGGVQKIVFANGEPDMAGEVTNCFEEPGLLYRIVNRANKTWAFYNDSRAFEVHVVCTFGKHSKITALENTKVERDDSTGEYVAQVTVFPGETEPFIKGFVNGFASKLRALPLSQDYYKDRSEAQNEQIVQAEIDAIRAIAGDETDAERILQICLENNLPFVDLSFPPVQASLDSGASKPFKSIPWARPSMYIKPELQDQVRLFRNGIRPGDVLQGELGDCWLMCALATQAENPTAIMQLFRHPKGADLARRERAIGAYRVSFNKNGLWRSIVVDDYFPVVAGVPTFAHSDDPCELWPAVLEKAFAKLHGSYAMIQSGDPMHALTDMSGFPAMRIDDIFVEASANGGRDLSQKLTVWHTKGYQSILTTAGKAPAISADSKSAPDFSDQPELETALAGTGLLPGHAYSVLDVKEFNKGKTRLICVRNPWVYDEGWTQQWGWESAEWQEHRDIAAACNYARNKGDRSIVWMTFESALQYFVGGGVLFRDVLANDARIPMTFADCVPGAVLSVTVKRPTTVTFILSNMDHRGMHVKEVGAAESDPNNMDYPPIMLSLASPVEGERDVYHVIANSSADATQTSDGAWLFLQAREIAMMCNLVPSAAPYLVIPRLMESEETVASGATGGGEDMRELVHPIHFFNDHAHLSPQASGAHAKEIAVTVGIETEGQFGTDVEVTLCHMDGRNAVFENFPKFDTEGVETQGEMYFQVKIAGCGYAQEKAGSYIC
ncbi:putative calpain-like cysteine peptidase putative cysteine peptidase Clan CA family C2 [Leptomonas seymouri]|uniref:Putative calpain-like cysteine peptidase putative cysteine peptidase Clan CA family C2 n=1 Tax=Leptomonas seymouri TaxID=5684 RepID=A0A0N1P9P1_LEPSE|nr:putative calpain-like cysteine peptidase putative cysteine peptidase Clan CA family C2 [Leptomonas seymouri]|eukprot:KPI82880.1 putative calpain-like cysteine peptidase putative cysteine peptidase Clan CA family C2 [Leptomonas seymouri]